MAGSVRYQSVLILGPSPSPTLDFYLANVPPRAAGATLDIRDARGPCEDFPRLERATWVVVFRHAHISWLRALVRNRRQVARVTWFMDDDIPGAIREKSLPRLYAWKTYARYFRIRGLLGKLATDYAFSTAELAARYPALRGEVWHPRPVRMDEKRDRMLYFYHGTAAHRLELAWLAPIVAEVQRRVPEAWFEVFADKATRELFRDIPRVRCIHPMSWPDFLAYTATFRADVGLAPLLDTPFNRTRAPVKFFDISRTGAAGIYSDCGVYQRSVRHGIDGLLLPNEPATWTESIVRLLRSGEERNNLHTNARKAIDTGAGL